MLTCPSAAVRSAPTATQKQTVLHTSLHLNDDWVAILWNRCLKCIASRREASSTQPLMSCTLHSIIELQSFREFQGPRHKHVHWKAQTTKPKLQVMAVEYFSASFSGDILVPTTPTSDHFACPATPHSQRRLGEEIRLPTPNSDLIHDTSPSFSAPDADKVL
jgi:hypothetical protein